jgi:glutathione S-transferase
MSNITIYGTPASRAFRCLWMAIELGIDYENETVDFRDGGTRAPEYLAINPNGKIPALRDGDLVLWESMAINLYLSRKFPGPLTPSGIEDEALAIQWSIWGVLEIETPLVTILFKRFLAAESERDEAAAAKAEVAMQAPLKVMDEILAHRDWLVGDAFSVADLNVGGVMSLARRIDVDLSAHSNVDRWLERCITRPAAVAALEMSVAATPD